MPLENQIQVLKVSAEQVRNPVKLWRPRNKSFITMQKLTIVYKQIACQYLEFLFQGKGKVIWFMTRFGLSNLKIYDEPKNENDLKNEDEPKTEDTARS